MARFRIKSLKGYEGANLLLFLFVIVILAVFVSFVFKSYKDAGQVPSGASGENEGILSEVVSPATDTCVYYLGTKLTETRHQHRNRLEIPVTDDGLVRGLFEIPGIEAVTVDQRLIVIQKTPSATWDAIQPGVREIIKNHLHMHH